VADLAGLDLQSDIKHLKEFIASCGTYSNLVKQAQSKQKIIDKMIEAGLTEKVEMDRSIKFHFPDCGKLPPPVLAINSVSFSYDGKKENYLYTKLELSVDLDSRIALIGPNGVCARPSPPRGLLPQPLCRTKGPNVPEREIERVRESCTVWGVPFGDVCAGAGGQVDAAEAHVRRAVSDRGRGPQAHASAHRQVPPALHGSGATSAHSWITGAWFFLRALRFACNHVILPACTLFCQQVHGCDS
jgi:hypothetical protein